MERTACSKRLDRVRGRWRTTLCHAGDKRVSVTVNRDCVSTIRAKASQVRRINQRVVTGDVRVDLGNKGIGKAAAIAGLETIHDWEICGARLPCEVDVAGLVNGNSK